MKNTLKKRIGVIDIGTLKIKLLVADVANTGKTNVVYQSNTLTCLGVRMHENNNKPHAENLAKTIDELKRCKSILKENKVDQLRVVSTHALREMGAEGIRIAGLIKKETGFTVEIISQKEEAELFFNAVMSDFTSTTDFTVVDVGGGSVQILIGNKHELKQTYLLKTGSQHLFDIYSPRHTENDCPTPGEIKSMQEYIETQLAPIPYGIKTPLIYGSSCIIDLFKALKLPLGSSPHSAAHPYQTAVSELESFLETIIPIPYCEREKRYPFNLEYYMWGVDKSFLNIVTISRKIQAPYIIPSNANINKGLLLSLMSEEDIAYKRDVLK